MTIIFEDEEVEAELRVLPNGRRYAVIDGMVAMPGSFVVPAPKLAWVPGVFKRHREFEPGT